MKVQQVKVQATWKKKTTFFLSLLLLISFSGTFVASIALDSFNTSLLFFFFVFTGNIYLNFFLFNLMIHSDVIHMLSFPLHLSNIIIRDAGFRK